MDNSKEHVKIDPALMKLKENISKSVESKLSDQQSFRLCVVCIMLLLCIPYVFVIFSSYFYSSVYSSQTDLFWGYELFNNNNKYSLGLFTSDAIFIIAFIYLIIWKVASVRVRSEKRMNKKVISSTENLIELYFWDRAIDIMVIVCLFSALSGLTIRLFNDSSGALFCNIGAILSAIYLIVLFVRVKTHQFGTTAAEAEELLRYIARSYTKGSPPTDTGISVVVVKTEENRGIVRPAKTLGGYIERGFRST